MKGWHALNLGDGMLAWEPLEQIEKAFAPAYERAGKPGDMAIFKRHQSEGSLHCEVWVYFSPAAAELAREFDARACTRPFSTGLDLLAGSDLARGKLFSSDP